MAIKPILDVSHRGRRIRVQLAGWQKGVAMRYDILLDETPIQARSVQTLFEMPSDPPPPTEK